MDRCLLWPARAGLLRLNTTTWRLKVNDNLKRWLPWIAVAAVAIIVVIIIAVNSGGDDEAADTTTTTSEGETTTTSEGETTTTSECETTTTAAAPVGEPLSLAS